MTSRIKKITRIGILIFGISLLLLKCEKDSEQIEPIQEKIDFTVKPQMKTFSLSELESDNKFNNLKSSFNILQNNTLFESRNGTSYSSRLVDTLGITIDENSITQITYDGYVSYTMLMVEPEDTSGNTSNLVIQEHNGNERIFTVRYTNDASRNSNSTSSNFQMRSGIKSYTDFWGDDEGNGGGGGTDDCEQYETVCNTVNVWIPVSCGCGHSGDDPCSGCYGVYASWTLGTQDECEDICVDYGDGNYNPSNGNPNTGGGQTYNNTEPTEVATTPVNPDGTNAMPEALANLLNITDEEFLQCISNPQYEEPVSEALNYLTENNATIDAQSFVTQGLQAVCNGGVVDFELEIILEINETIEFQNQTCLKSIKDDVVSTGEMTKIIKKFEPTYPVLHLEWGMFTNSEWGNTGNTGLNTNQDTAFINLNSESLPHVNNIVMVKTIAHELIHAELYRKLKELVDDLNIISLSEYNDLQDNFMGIADYTLRFGEVTAETFGNQVIVWGLDPDYSLAHHNQMAAFYRQTLIDVMRAYDTSKGITRTNAEEFYEALSWAGLRITSDENGENSQYTDAWKNFKDQIDIDEADLPESQRTYNRYVDIINQEYSGSGINCD